MISAGLCDILASDYYYPALLLAIARLQKDLGWGLAQLWPLVAQNPARALGLTDRGVIAQGQRADLVLIEWPEGGTPVARMTWAAGALAYAALPSGGLV
jgi:alpha-D-ribose 1-methylphosphonate 5-triphosphate diphosphatase